MWRTDPSGKLKCSNLPAILSRSGFSTVILIPGQERMYIMTEVSGSEKSRVFESKEEAERNIK